MLLIIALLLLIGATIVISFIIYKLVKRWFVSRYVRLLCLLPFLVLFLLIYLALYPGDEFYAEDYYEVTGLQLPGNACIVKKSATYPDPFGDYSSAARIILNDNNHYNSLPFNLIKKDFVERENKLSTAPLSYVENTSFEELNYARQFVKEVDQCYYFVGFVDDKKAIVVSRASY